MTIVPFYRPDLQDDEIAEVLATLKEGWLTTGPRTKTFEERFARAVGAPHAVALNSCTAALHLAVEALGLKAGEGVLVPTMTFAATAEVVRYQGAIPILVDCDPVTGNIDLSDAERKLGDLREGRLPEGFAPDMRVVGIMPVHVGGTMVDIDAVSRFAVRHGLWVVEDAAHAFPAAWRPHDQAPWQQAGEHTADVTCFSFYANKTITTGEGGMATTADAKLADRMRLMSLHGLSRDAWTRYSGGGTWDYKIVAPGYKYNLTDIASAIGLHQLARAESLRQRREEIAHQYLDALAAVDEIELPPVPEHRQHAWHLFPIRIRPELLTIGRDVFYDEVRKRGVVCSVHWRPLHLHPYYEETFAWQPQHCPAATALFARNLSLPLFPGIRPDEIAQVVEAVVDTVSTFRSRAAASPAPPDHTPLAPAHAS